MRLSILRRLFDASTSEGLAFGVAIAGPELEGVEVAKEDLRGAEKVGIGIEEGSGEFAYAPPA